MALSQMSYNQVGFEKSKQELDHNLSEISTEQNSEVIFSSQSNAAEITNKKIEYTISKPNEKSDQTDGINLATGMTTLGNILEILDSTENHLKKQAENLKQNEVTDMKIGEEKLEEQDFLKKLMTSPYILKILKWIKILIWLIMVALVLRGLFLGGSETIIGEMNSKNTQKDKSNPVIVNIAPGSSGKQGPDSNGKTENNDENEAGTELTEFDKFFKMFQYLQKMQPIFADASPPRVQNKKWELLKENHSDLRSVETLKKIKLENFTVPFK